MSGLVDADARANQDRTAELANTRSVGLPDHTIRRIRELIVADREEFDRLLSGELSKVAQALIDRGLYNSTIQITESQGACDRSLHARCQRTVEAIRRVLSTHRIGFSDVLADELQSLFQDLYDTALAEVSQAFRRAVPEQNKILCATKYEGVSVDKYRVEIELLADALRHDNANPNGAG